jgi:uncharacterized protein (DUF952 family)
MPPSHTQKSQARFIYRLCRPADWARAQRTGVFAGSADDARDGFLHFSTAPQVAETARRHYASERSLLLIEIEAQALGPDLRWEPSRGGALFPHLYAPLDLASVRCVRPFRVPDKERAHAR